MIKIKTKKWKENTRLEPKITFFSLICELRKVKKLKGQIIINLKCKKLIKEDR